MDADAALVRHGELYTKSRPVQQRMEQQLVDNLEAMLASRNIDATVDRRRLRPIIRVDPGEADDAAEAAADVFGVVSASPAVSTGPGLDAIVDALADLAADRYTAGAFAINARRAEKQLGFTSQDISEQGGDAVLDGASDHDDPHVNLDDPDTIFSVEAHADAAYVFVDTVDGPGGLPLGAQGKQVCLLSGGIDSPVAVYELMRRGSPVIPLYLDLGEYGGPDHQARALDAVRVLSAYAPQEKMRLHVAPAGDAVKRIAESMEKGRMLAFRRFMYRVADHLAREEDAAGIVTGEALGQKSSQTAANFAVTSPATDLPVHRPLLSWDKNDITARAQEIGTYMSSTINAGCDRFAPGQPATRATLEDQCAREPDDLFDWAREVADGTERVPGAGDR